ncbi:hypothetical protein [Nocardia sp. NPDC004722]
MARQTVVVLLIVVMVALIIGVDILVFRHHFWARLLANAGIVLIFAACYLRFVKGT